MVQSLKNHSLIAVASAFWKKHKLNKLGPSELQIIAKYREAAYKFGQQIKTLGLPKNLESELVLVIFELGKTENYKKDMMYRIGKDLQVCGLTLLPDTSGIFDENDFLDLASIELLDGLIRNVFLNTESWLHNMPGMLDSYIPEKDIQQMVMKLLFILMTQNPCDIRTVIREFWTSHAFVSCQSTFLDNFKNICSCFKHGTIISTFRVNLTHSTNERNSMKSRVITSIASSLITNAFYYPVSDTLPWFVFEVLNTDQRDKFLEFGETTLVTRTEFGPLFANIFCHWPWQDEAFDIYFARKQELSKNDKTLLQIILESTRDEEEMVRLGMLPADRSFHLKVKKFYDAKMEAESQALNELENLGLSDD